MFVECVLISYGKKEHSEIPSKNKYLGPLDAGRHRKAMRNVIGLRGCNAKNE
jgi:hypothetical protein